MQQTEFDFNYVFRNFHQPIKHAHADLKNTMAVYPDPAEQLLRIQNIASISCNFGLMVDAVHDRITAIPGVSFPFATEHLNDETFCKLIHPNYLIPFLLFAQFAYEISKKASYEKEEIFAGVYTIPVPLKLPNSNEYIWYIQHGFALEINDKKQILKHLNLYTLERTCLPLANGEIENRFVEANFLINNQLAPIFQQFLQQTIKSHIKSTFEKQYKKMKMLKLLQNEISLSNKALATLVNLSEETIKSYSKEILQKIKSILGYQFTTLREAVTALSHKGYL